MVERSLAWLTMGCSLGRDPVQPMQEAIRAARQLVVRDGNALSELSAAIHAEDGCAHLCG